MHKLVFYGTACDPIHDMHKQIPIQILSEGRAETVHIAPSGTRPDKAYKVSNEHRRRMLEILIEEQNLRERLVANFAFIHATREQSSAYGVYTWYLERGVTDLCQVFGVDVIQYMSGWIRPEWVKKEASKIFIPRGDEVVDYSGLSNFTIMPFCGPDELIKLSSSVIRARIPLGDFTGLSPGVAEYIRQNGLYLPPKNQNTVSMNSTSQQIPFYRDISDK